MSDQSVQLDAARDDALGTSHSDSSTVRNAHQDIFEALNAIDWNFASAKTDYFAHGIHPYPAKFIPQLPNTLISKLSNHGDLVWDPFGGSGTTALEALLLGRRAISTDLNPVAQVIGTAKTTTLTPEIEVELSQLVTELRMLTSSSHRIQEALSPLEGDRSRVPEIPNHDKWFTAEATAELAYLRFRIEHLLLDESKAVALACFSKEILGASNQDSETRYTAIEKGIVAGDVIARFARALSSSIDKLSRQASHLQFRSAVFATADARKKIVGSEPSSTIATESVDLVVTSPPYPNATDYHLYHRFRIFWLGHDPRGLASSEIGSHLRHQKQKTEFGSYISEMTLVLANVYLALKPGSFAVFVVGDAIFNKELFETAKHLGEAAVSVGFEQVGIINRDLPENKRSFSSPARRLRTEQLLVLFKPSADIVIALQPPSYKMQPYEDLLALQEIESLVGKPELTEEGLIVRLNRFQRNQARRLAFTSALKAKSGSTEPTWQAVLESGESAHVGRKDPKYVTHGIHPYKGKFYPQLAKALFNTAKVEPGSTVIDPFCGSGTVLLEAALSGCNAVGFDVNPVAIATAVAKVGAVGADAVYRDHLLCSFERKLQALSSIGKLSSSVRFNGAILDEIVAWFPAPVIQKMSAVLAEIDDVPDAHTRDILRVALSSIIRDISHQEPRDLRIRRRALPLDDAPVFELLTQKIRDIRRRLRHFASVKNHAPYPLGRAQANLSPSDEADSFAKASLKDESVDLVVTSPPYATALPYIDTDRLSMLVCHSMTSDQRKCAEDQLIGSREITTRQRNALNSTIEEGDLRSLNSSIARKLVRMIHSENQGTDAGFRKLNTAALLLKYFEKMDRVVQNLTRVVKPAGSAFVVIGDTKTTAGGTEIKISSGRVIEQQFNAAGWSTEHIQPITVTRENVVHSKNTITTNEIYWFKKG
ncbi:DNA methyltransferase [Montanilutibacter psychrotolerans]|uniref:site-specific DNA-methyltransferase (cytosine-N(4)-specific) n=1 Tax=Montanilutibacter psychrotolerans TaxID=1327343 RepID=A0A3M8SRA7_9GAMM|nr:DNA methyltransferase [Lysobacter psychrotolerans]RNF83871.1 restriction endonuclease [Lysobacter psychrotolerans]